MEHWHWCQTAHTDLFLQRFQGLKLQASQHDVDVFGDIWDEEGQDELEGQQPVLETHNDNKRRVTGAAVVSRSRFFPGPFIPAGGCERVGHSSTVEPPQRMI